MRGTISRRTVIAIAALALAAAGYGVLQVRERNALARADEMRAGEIAREFAEGRAENEEAWNEARDARLEKAAADLASPSGMVQCDAALLIGRSGSKDYILPLVDMLNAPHATAKTCAATALIDIGEPNHALAAYMKWIDGEDPMLRQAAISGFCHMGPDGAKFVLPYLERSLNHGSQSERYIAAECLPKLGPTAVPLLESVVDDPDANVSTRARRGLAELGRR